MSMSTNTITTSTRGLRKGRAVRRNERAAHDVLHRMMLDGEIGGWSIIDTDEWLIQPDHDGAWPMPKDTPTLTRAEVHAFLADRGHAEFAVAAPKRSGGAAVPAAGAGARAAATKRRNAAIAELLARAVEHLPADMAAEAAALLGDDFTTTAA